MRKTLSAILSAAMLTAALTGTALAADNDALPALVPDAPQSFTFQPSEDDIAYAAFTPTENGYYQFVCDTPYTGTSQDPESEYASWTASIYEDTEGEPLQGFNFGFDIDSSNLTDEQKKEVLKVMPHPERVAAYAELTAGKRYVFKLSNKSTTSFTSNLTVSIHKHTFGEYVTEKSGVSNDGTTYGGVYRYCTVCAYMDYSEVFPQVNECILEKEKYVCDGKAKKPAVTVTTVDENYNLPASQYTVSYKNNKNVGKATVIITFKGNYKGKVTKTFKIVPKGTAFTGYTAKKRAVVFRWKKQSKQTSGYEIQYCAKRSFEGAKTVTVNKNKTTSKKIKGLKSNKKYYFRIRTYTTVNGKKYCSGWSHKKSVRVK